MTSLNGDVKQRFVELVDDIQRDMELPDERRRIVELPDEDFTTPEGLEQPPRIDAQLTDDMTPLSAAERYMDQMRARRAFAEDDSYAGTDMLRTGAFGEPAMEHPKVNKAGQQTRIGDTSIHTFKGQGI